MSQNANKPLSENKTWQAIGAYAEAKEEIARLTAENERLTEDNRQLTKVLEIAESIIKRMGKVAVAAAKEGRDAK